MNTNQIDVEITVQGHFCNEWPDIEIVGNNHIYFTGPVKDLQVIRFSISEQPRNQVIIRHMNKRFGEGGMWDTKTNQNNEIINDRAVELVDFELNSVSIKSWIHNNCKFVTSNGEQVRAKYFGYNGSVSINFDTPVYEWIICNCVRQKATVESRFIIESTMDTVFDYDKDLKEIEEIERILEQHAHLFS